MDWLGLARNGLGRDCPAEIRWGRGLVVRRDWWKRATASARVCLPWV